MNKTDVKTTQWRGMQLIYESHILEPNDTRECSFCLTLPQAKMLIAIIEPYRYVTRWFSEEELDKEKIEQFVNDTQRRLMEMCCEDNSDDILKTLRQMQAFEFFKLDDGTPQSYAPDTKDYFNRDSTNSAEDMLRNNQLCIAVRDWCYLYAQEYLKYLSSIGAVLGAGAGISFYTGNPIAGFIFAIAAGIIESLGITAIQDSDAMQEVICCMIDGLKEQTVTQAHFRAALDGCDFTFGSHEAQIAGALNSFNQTDENYRAFLVHLGQSKTGAFPDIDQCTDCAEDFVRIYVSSNNLGGGHEVSFIDGTLAAQSVSGGPQGNILYLTPDQHASESTDPIDNTICCKFVVEGSDSTDTVNFASYRPCNSNTDTSPGLTGSQDTCANLFVFTSSAPFILYGHGIPC